MDNRIDFAKVAYEAYRTDSGGKSLISDAQLPQYEQLSPEIKRAWAAAAEAVMAHFIK